MKYKHLFLINILLVFLFVVSACAPAATPAPAAAPTEQPQAPAAAAPTEKPQEPTALPATEKPQEPPAPTKAPEPTLVERSGPKEIILATTTSTRDSGLLDVLLPMFEKQSGYTVKMIAVGSGQAMKMGEMGNADVLLVHSPKAEQDFMAKGFGTERLLVMHNDFIVVGPADDPAKIKGTASPVEAFKKIADAKAKFYSRADKSGTNAAELAIWAKVGVTPTEADAWYIQTGQGMGDTLRIASETQGYTLTDRATYLAQKDTLDLEILVEGDPTLFNVYHVIPVNPEKFSTVFAEGGKAFADFIVSPEIQKVIGEFGKDKFKQSLFFPDAGKPEK